MKRSVPAILVVLCILSAVLPQGALALGAVPAPVLEAVDSVVRIRAESAEYISTGSGFSVYSDAEASYIATNYHVVEDDPFDIAVWVNSTETVQAEIFAGSREKDLCILKLQYPIPSLRALPLQKEKAARGDAVYAVGFPGAADSLSLKDAHDSSEATVTDGIVSALRTVSVSEYGAEVSLYQINAAINSGNSGGPLFNEKGEVIGINTYSAYDSQGIFGAIAAAELIAFMQDHGVPMQEAAKGSAVAWLLFGAAALFLLAAAAFLLFGKRKKKKNGKPQPLSALMAGRQLPYTRGEAVRMLMPAAFFLRDLHHRGMCHLEIAPDTVTVAADGSAGLIPPTGNEINRYRSGFAAPEIYAGKAAGALSDIYSFTALLYYLTTASVPENALARANSENEDALYGSIAPEDPFLQLLERGMDPTPAERIQDMQQLIGALMPYMEQPAAPAEKPEKGNKMSGAIRFCVIGTAVIILLGIYTGCYIKTVTLMREMKAHEAARYMFVPAVKLHDRRLPAYVEAGKLFEDRKFEEACDAFAALGYYRESEYYVPESQYRAALKLLDAGQYGDAEDAFALLAQQGFRDSAEKIKEARYRKGAHLLYVEGDYALAYKVFEQLSNEGYAKAEDMAAECMYLWGCDLIEQEEILTAYDKLKDIEWYADTEDLLYGLRELIYYEGQQLYAMEEYEAARKYFSKVADYGDTDQYLLLIDAFTRDYAAAGDSSLDLLYENLLDILDFENACDAILWDQSLAERFLYGEWEDSRGKYRIIVEANGNMSADLPGYEPIGYYYIERGAYYSYGEDQEWYEGELQYVFGVIDENTLSVYNGNTDDYVVLYRQ